MNAAPIFLYDDPTMPFHDYRCPCSGHCRNCGRVLEGRQRKYCSDYCGQRWRAELALDEVLKASLVPIPSVEATR